MIILAHWGILEKRIQMNQIDKIEWLHNDEKSRKRYHNVLKSGNVF